MPRAGVTYDIATRASGDAHVSDTSTGVADVKTIVPPRDCTAMYLAAETNGVRITFDGTVPDGTQGMPLAAGQRELFPIGRTIKFVSQAAANAVLHALFLE